MKRRRPASQKKPEFGKRGREEAVQPERRLTSMERLKKIGSRWWGKTGSRKGMRPTARQGRA